MHPSGRLYFCCVLVYLFILNLRAISAPRFCRDILKWQIGIAIHGGFVKTKLFKTQGFDRYLRQIILDGAQLDLRICASILRKFMQHKSPTAESNGGDFDGITCFDLINNQHELAIFLTNRSNRCIQDSDIDVRNGVVVLIQDGSFDDILGF